jgi:hypothetical protein
MALVLSYVECFLVPLGILIPALLIYILARYGIKNRQINIVTIVLGGCLLVLLFPLLLRYWASQFIVVLLFVLLSGMHYLFYRSHLESTPEDERVKLRRKYLNELGVLVAVVTFVLALVWLS